MVGKFFNRTGGVHRDFGLSKEAYCRFTQAISSGFLGKTMSTDGLGGTFGLFASG